VERLTTALCIFRRWNPPRRPEGLEESIYRFLGERPWILPRRRWVGARRRRRRGGVNDIKMDRHVNNNLTLNAWTLRWNKGRQDWPFWSVEIGEMTVVWMLITDGIDRVGRTGSGRLHRQARTSVSTRLRGVLLPTGYELVPWRLCCRQNWTVEYTCCWQGQPKVHVR
jgi:hypothetical protein